MARRCPVCALETAEAVCPRCRTIVVRGRAICPKCGKLFSGPIASCDACGSKVPAATEGPGDAQAVRVLASVPGIGEARAKALVSQGFRDFSDIVRLALPPSAVEKGLHHAIARRVLLSSIGSKTEPPGEGRPCPTCGTSWPQDADRCPACGSRIERTVDIEILETKLQEVTGEIVDLAADPDFQGMPEATRQELLGAFGALNEADLLRDEYRRQIEAWRAKGFDVEPLERLLAEDLVSFQDRSVRLIRSQMMKKAEHGQFRCPLCEIRLESVAEECPNCGARFG
ncbi:MAG: hypothetical protein A3K66_02000 [Euryarchaeota archaeon RBG_16_67_27]|nr:MAG: hypothetical protein A3K66_02000 [Euryarchaeota archaeon RBG_16_67_27]